MLQLNFSSEFYDPTTCVMYSIEIKFRLEVQYTVNVELSLRVETLKDCLQITNEILCFSSL